jgi:hypothetical protein
MGIALSGDRRNYSRQTSCAILVDMAGMLTVPDSTCGFAGLRWIEAQRF